jgi:hypothetical protein
MFVQRFTFVHASDHRHPQRSGSPSRLGGASRSARRRFTAKRATYLARQYKLKSRYDRFRERGILTKIEAGARLDVHEHTLARCAEQSSLLRSEKFHKNRG